MKTHNLFCHAKIILEAEDDMFPGIGSSAFDEKKPKDEKETQQSEYERLQLQQERLQDVFNTYEHHHQVITKQLADGDAFIYVGGGANLGPNDVRYSSFDWLNNYPDAAHELSNRAIDKNSPLFKNIENKVHAFDRYEKRLLTIEGDIELIRKKLANIRVQVEASKLKRAKT